MILLSIIPLAGASIVMFTTGIFQAVQGRVLFGLGIAAVGFFISTIDNLIRPRLVGSGAKLHDLVIFFSTLGGIAVFGIMGFIVGPVIAALFITIIDIYGLEFSKELNHPETKAD
jgi:predicted PurR-regulated permease PerM